MANPFLAQRIQRQQLDQTLPARPPEPSEYRPSLLSQAATGLTDLPMAALNAIDYIAALPRAAIARAQGIEGSGRETLFGRAASGRELLGLGEGERGVLEPEDVTGFIAELALDPLSYIGIGIAGKATTKVAQANRLKNVARAAELQGRSEVARDALQGLRRLGFNSIDDVPELGTLGQQARAGERSLISVGLPGTRGIPLVRAPRVLDAAERLGRAIPRLPGVRGAVRRLRPGGRGGPEVFQSIDAAPFNAAVDVSQGVSRRVQREGERFGRDVAKRIRQVATEDPQKIKSLILEANRATQPVRERISQIFEEAISKTVDERKIAALTQQRDRALQSVSVPGVPSGPLIPNAAAISTLGLEKADAGLYEAARKKVNDILTETRASNSARLQAARKRAQKLEAAGDEDAARRVISKARAANRRQRTKAMLRARTTIGQGQFSEILERQFQIHTPELMHELQRVRAALGERLASEQIAGVPISSLSDPLLHYAHRSVTQEGRAWIETLKRDDPFVRLIREIDTKGGPAQERVALFRGLSIPQINDLARARGLKGDLFTENLAEGVVRRFSKGAEMESAASLWSGVIQQFAVPKGAIEGGISIPKALEKSKLARVRVGGASVPVVASGKKGGRKLKDFRKAIKDTELEGMVLPPDVVEHMSRVHQVMRDPDDWSGMLRFFDRVNGTFRGAMTQFFPDFHLRNGVGNLFMMGLAGMRDARYLARAAKLQRAAARGDKAARNLMMEAAEYASVGRGLSREALELGGEIAPGLSKAQGVLRKGHRSYQRAFSAAAEAGQSIEDNSKLALYLWGRKAQKMSKTEAGDLVRRYLFDYQDLSRFEEKYLRRAAFFYTYTRKALPLLVQTFAQPRNLALLGHATGEVGSARQDRLDLPPWQRARLPFDVTPVLNALGLESAGNERQYLFADLPVTEMFRFGSEDRGVQRTAQKLAANLAPTFRFPLEQLTGVNLSTGMPLSERGLGQRGLEALPPELRRTLEPLARAEKLLPSARFTGTINRAIEQAEGGETARALLSPVAALVPREINTTEQRRRNSMRQIRQALQNYERVGLGDTERAKELRRLRARLAREAGMQK